MMKSVAVDLSSYASQVWSATTIEDKKSKSLLLIQSMKFKGKTAQFTQVVLEATNPKKLDKLAADIVLCDTDKVIW